MEHQHFATECCFLCRAAKAPFSNVTKVQLFGGFVKQLQPALRNVKQLQIILPFNHGADSSDSEVAATTASTEFLLTLASACPRLAKLSIDGRVGPTLLQTFGQTCPALASLSIVPTNLTTSTLQHLSEFLPHLTSLAVVPDVACRENHNRGSVSPQSCNATCIALRTLPNLLHLDTTHHEMTDEVWATFPLGLTSCITSAPGISVQSSQSNSSSSRQQHSGLKRLVFCDQEAVTTLTQLASLLEAAPNLIEFGSRHATRVSVSLTGNWLRDLSLLDTRMGAVDRLKIVQKLGDQEFKEIPLLLDFDISESGRGHSTTDTFLRLKALGTTTLSNLTQLRFINLGSINLESARSPNALGDLSQFARSFPRVQNLTFQHVSLNDSNMQTLGSCPFLERLDLLRCDGVTCVGLSILLAAPMSLKCVTCIKCKNLSPEDGNAIQAIGDSFAALVCVSIR